MQRQHEETHQGAAATPFVTYLLVITQLAIGTFHVIVGPNLLTSGAVQEGNHLVKLGAFQHGQYVDQLGHLGKLQVLAQRQPAIPRLPHAGRVEETVELVGEGAEHGQIWQILQHGAEVASLAWAEVFPARDDEIAVLEDEVGFVLAGE